VCWIRPRLGRRFAARLIAWPFVVLFLLLTARVLGGKASYTSTFRVTGFAYFGYWLTLLSFVPVVGRPLFQEPSCFLLAFLGVLHWGLHRRMNCAVAHAACPSCSCSFDRRGRGAAGPVPGRGDYDRFFMQDVDCRLIIPSGGITMTPPYKRHSRSSSTRLRAKGNRC